MDELKRKGIMELCEWLGAQPEIKNSTVQLEYARKAIIEQGIEGDNFLICTQEDWRSVGVPLGVAKTLVQISDRLKKESGVAVIPTRDQ